MFIAVDINNNRVHIEESMIRHDYYCPYCELPLIVRKGTVRRHHFAHKPNALCRDTWQSEYDVSDWHADWQNLYPKQNQEILCQLGEIRHRADVMIDRTVIEFQHSSLSARKFAERNHFYNELGYKVIWVFDLIENYESGQIVSEFSGGENGIIFKWTRPRSTFKDSDILSGFVEVFFQLNSDGHQSLVRVDDTLSSGMERFSFRKWYSKDQFLSYTGLLDGKCALPYHEDEAINQQYIEFCDKYNIRLNKQQERAVQLVEGANLLLAVPGSGKTTVLVCRLGYMTHCRGIDPRNILSITYTKAAAEEMKERYKKLFGAAFSNQITFKTINSLCVDIINTYATQKSKKKPFDIVDAGEKKKILSTLYKEIEGDYATESEIIGIETVITYIKNMMLENEINNTEFAINNAIEYYNGYNKVLQNSGLMDYDDQVIYAYRILKKYPDILKTYNDRFKYISVDEAQDTSKLQHSVIRLLVGDNNIFMVGDEDQSIFGFRGAYPEALMRFRDEYSNPFVLYMERNYRSTQEIVCSAQKFIERNTKRHPKHMISNRGKGEPIERIVVNSRQEQYNYLVNALQEKEGSMAVLYRDNECSIPLIDLLIRTDIPYYTPQSQIVFFSSRIVLDIKAFLKLSIDPYDTESFMRIYYKCGMGFNKQTAEYACNKSKRKRVTVLDSLVENLSKWPSLHSKALHFSDNIKNAAKKPPHEAIEYLCNTLYKNYLNNNVLYVLKWKE